MPLPNWVSEALSLSIIIILLSFPRCLCMTIDKIVIYHVCEIELCQTPKKICLPEVCTGNYAIYIFYKIGLAILTLLLTNITKLVHGALLLAYMHLWYVNWVKINRFHFVVGYQIPNSCSSCHAC